MDETGRNKAVIRRLIEIVNAGDTARLAEVVAPDHLSEMTAHVAAVRGTFPDLHLTIERQIAEDQWVASQVTARGTHRGEWLGMKPTGKTLVMSAVDLDRVVDGKIVEHGGAANMLEALLGAGALRPVS